MKQTLFFIVVLFICQQNAIAQQSFGVKAGVNLADQHRTAKLPPSSDVLTQNTKTLWGYQLGVFFKLKLDAAWTLAAEANFSIVGSRMYYVTEQQIFQPGSINHYFHNKMGYIDIPLSLQYTVNKFYFGAGPGIAFKVLSKITNYEGYIFDAPQYKTLDFAANALAGYKISKKMDINLRYSYGFSNMFESNSLFTSKNRFLNLSLLYSLK